MFLPIGCAIVAVDMAIAAGTVSIIYALQSLLTAVVAGPFLGERVTTREWTGLAVAFVGETIAGDYGGLSAPGIAYLLTMVGTVGMVAATVIAKALMDETPILPAIGIQSSFSAALFLPFALADVLNEGRACAMMVGLIDVLGPSVFRRSIKDRRPRHRVQDCHYLQFGPSAWFRGAVHPTVTSHRTK
ncbi:DMT family transporter [Mesorhizobium sp. M0518]|uniref:DMT family transporter n=1 Tax=Mesorhizobium sp. M0518 TaxID=2956956 RepID=UPI0033356A5F